MEKAIQQLGCRATAGALALLPYDAPRCCAPERVAAGMGRDACLHLHQHAPGDSALEGAVLVIAQTSACYASAEALTSACLAVFCVGFAGLAAVFLPPSALFS